MSLFPDAMPDPRRRRGLMLVVSSPSGAGKTSLTRRLLELDPEVTLSISVTTRTRRPSEIDGVHYHFLDEARFTAMIERRELLEHARVYGHHYGTPRAAVEAVLAQGRDVLFDIDWQGAQQLRAAAAEDMVGVFILPPSMPELERRLRTRAEDSDETVRFRLAQVANDATHWAEYDYVIINRELEASVAALRAVLSAERLRRRRHPALNAFVEQFRNPVPG
jgi:guanylate kinase